jgi:putative transposase
MKVNQARRLKELERENQRLRKAVSDLTLDKLILKEAAEGNF